MAKDHPTGESGLYSALLELKTPEECYRFLQDVCSYAELSAMEQRYNIAEKLVGKESYTSIMGNIGASSAACSKKKRPKHPTRPDARSLNLSAAFGGSSPARRAAAQSEAERFFA